MKFFDNFLFAALALPVLAIPIEVPEVQSPYYNPDLLLDKTDMQILIPVKGSGGVEKSRPTVAKDISLKKDITLAWKNKAVSNAQLKANWNEAPHIKVINMEDFGDSLEAVDCTAPYMFLDFSDATVFRAAMKEWEWVNSQPENQIIIFADHPACGGDSSRDPYNITSISYDTKALKANMKVLPIDHFENFIVDGEIEFETYIDPSEILPSEVFDEDTEWDPNFGTPPATKRDAVFDHPISRRQSGSKSISLNLDHDLTGKVFDIGLNGNNIRLDCTDCRTRGQIKATGYFKISWFKLKTAYVEFSAKDVQAVINLKLAAHLEQHIVDHKVLLPLTAFVGIPKLLALRAGVDIGVSWDLLFEANGVITWGVTGTMVNSVYRNCLKGCNDQNSGWTWSWTKRGPNFEGDLTATVNMAAYVNPKVGVEVCGFGYEGGVAILAPKFEGKISFMGNTQGGICDDAQTTSGLSVDLAYGYEGYAYAGRDFQQTDWKYPLFGNMFPFFDECYPLTTNGDILTAEARAAVARCEKLHAFSKTLDTIGKIVKKTMTACDAKNWEVANSACININSNVQRRFGIFLGTFLITEPARVCKPFSAAIGH